MNVNLRNIDCYKITMETFWFICTLLYQNPLLIHNMFCNNSIDTHHQKSQEGGHILPNLSYLIGEGISPEKGTKFSISIIIVLMLYSRNESFWNFLALHISCLRIYNFILHPRIIATMVAKWRRQSEVSAPGLLRQSLIVAAKLWLLCEQLGFDQSCSCPPCSTFFAMEALFHAYPDSEDDDVHQSKRHKSIHQPAITPIVPPPVTAGAPRSPSPARFADSVFCSLILFSSCRGTGQICFSTRTCRHGCRFGRASARTSVPPSTW